MWWTNFVHSFINQLAVLRITDLIDILAVSYLVYKALKFVRDTKTMQLIKGLVLLVVVTQVSSFANLNTLHYILSNVLQLGLIAWLIVFQPELRRLLEHVGRSSMGKWFNSKGEFDENVLQMIRKIAHGAQAMSNNRVGALIVIENEDNISHMISAGITVDAEPTSELLENIFVPNTPLHDGAVVIRDGKIALAACVLPLSQNPNIRQALGTRHRAGIGISEESDAVVIIVSEETGNISVAYRGVLKTGYEEESLREQVIDLLSSSILTKNGSEKFDWRNIVKRGKNE
ncbi:MAG: diadenylate cyclase CdaA [Clostridia bacterium]|nr:diadenylate cyclase CdaA [Clostridia bacterium]